VQAEDLIAIPLTVMCLDLMMRWRRPVKIEEVVPARVLADLPDMVLG